MPPRLCLHLTSPLVVISSIRYLSYPSAEHFMQSSLPATLRTAQYHARARSLHSYTLRSSASFPVKHLYTTSPTMAPKQQPKIVEVQELKTAAKWLQMVKINWKDEDGKDRVWEAANRTKRNDTGADSVHVLALLNHPSRPLSTLLIEQYRPPIGKTVVEFPAGLIDSGEDAGQAALRELHEETGYGSGKDGEGNASLKEVSSILVKDPGMTGATMQLATVDVKLGENDEEPTQHLDEGEHIVRRVVPLKDLQATLKDYANRGFAVDALVACVAQGLALAESLRA